MKSRELLPVECHTCKTVYYRHRFRIKVAIAKGWRQTCSKKCQIKMKTTAIAVTCDTCGEEFFKKNCTVKDGHGNFCSSSCSAITNNKKHPKRKKLTKEKGIVVCVPSDDLDSLPERIERKVKRLDAKITDNIIVRIKKVKETNCILCGSKVVYTGKKSKSCKDCRSTLLRSLALTRVREGNHRGWSSRRKLQPSYPEKYFMDLFTTFTIIEDREYIRELPQDGFFVDFAFLDQRIAVEIDGKQHNYPDREERDKRKDGVLRDKGWVIHRVPWKNPINETNRKHLREQVIILFNLLGYSERLKTKEYKIAE